MPDERHAALAVLNVAGVVSLLCAFQEGYLPTHQPARSTVAAGRAAGSHGFRLRDENRAAGSLCGMERRPRFASPGLAYAWASHS